MKLTGSWLLGLAAIALPSGYRAPARTPIFNTNHFAAVGSPSTGYQILFAPDRPYNETAATVWVLRQQQPLYHFRLPSAGSNSLFLPTPDSLLLVELDLNALTASQPNCAVCPDLPMPNTLRLYRRGQLSDSMRLPAALAGAISTEWRWPTAGQPPSPALFTTDSCMCAQVASGLRCYNFRLRALAAPATAPAHSPLTIEVSKWTKRRARYFARRLELVP